MTKADFSCDIELARRLRLPKKIILVSAIVLIDEQRRVLISKRPMTKNMSNLWEFPGGKIESNETPENAVIREIKEELSLDICPSCLMPMTFASHNYDDFHLLMPLFSCRKFSGTAQALEGQELLWVKPNQLKDYPMPPANYNIIGLVRDLV